MKTFKRLFVVYPLYDMTLFVRVVRSFFAKKRKTNSNKLNPVRNAKIVFYVMSRTAP